jgi:hypothetical protein
MGARLRLTRVSARRALLAALLAAPLGGCFADPTEVVIVVDTDATPFKDFAQIMFSFSDGFSAFADAATLPATLGVRPGGQSLTFDVIVTLNTTMSFGQMRAPDGTATLTFATRKASEVRFVSNEMRVLFLPIPKLCSCTDASGMPITSCAHALDPACLDLRAPPLSELDEDNLPRLAKSPPPTL